MGLIKLAATNENLSKAKKYLLNTLGLIGIGTGVYGDALVLKKMFKKG